MTLYFITGNSKKFEQFSDILSPEIKVYQLEIELNEIQSIDPHEVIKHKLIEAAKFHQGEFLVDDTSLYLEALDYKLPGPLIKWFIKGIGLKSIYELAQKIGRFGAEAKVCLGYSDGKEIKFFDGATKGRISPPKGEDFGWNPIFIAEGETKTFAQMASKEKYKISPRGKALAKFKEYYLKSKKSD
jgi:non-canonical purine NTP pyrophosphatase (RdgB/HAM1 family)